MKQTRFTDTAQLGGVRRTADGYLVAEVRCARTGCQQYTPAEVGLVGDAPVTVYRPEEAVFDRGSLATYAGKPVTVGHPPEDVTADTWRKYAVGDIGMDIARDGEFVRVPIKIMDAAAIKAIEAGTREISMGYTADIEHRDGVAPDGTKYGAVQTGAIKINHLALVDRARGGERLRVGDGAENWGAAPITDTITKGAVMTDTLRTIVVDGLSVTTTDAGAQAIAKLVGQLADADTAAQTTAGAHAAEVATLAKEAEVKDGQLAALAKQLAEATAPAALADAAKARSKVLAEGKKAGMSDAQLDALDDAAIRRAVVDKRLGDNAKGMSDAAVEGAFAALASSATARPGDAPLGAGLQQHDAADPWAAFTSSKKEA